jgi:biotin operon repressor
MFTQERLRSVLIKFLDRDCGSVSRQELASELECTRDDVVKNEEMVKDTLVEIQEDKAIEDCKLILKNLLAKGINPTPESLADYLGISVRDLKEREYIFDYALAELREPQAVA